VLALAAMLIDLTGLVISRPAATPTDNQRSARAS
jgi:hypothetical protein